LVALSFLQHADGPDRSHFISQIRPDDRLPRPPLGTL
jgi:hypothetical protein